MKIDGAIKILDQGVEDLWDWRERNPNEKDLKKLAKDLARVIKFIDRKYKLKRAKKK